MKKHHLFITTPLWSYTTSIETSSFFGRLKRIAFSVLCILITTIGMSQSDLDSPCDCIDPLIIGSPDTETDISSLTSQFQANNCYFIKGTLVIDQQTFWMQVRLLMDEKSQILVETELTVDESYIAACGEMWKGIKAEDNSSLFVFHSTIESAEFGINFSSIIGFNCTHTAFVDDYIGICIGNPFTGPQRGTVQRSHLWGCEFYTKNGLPEPYPGQYYDPSWPVDANVPYNVGYAAIFMDGFAGLNIGYPEAIEEDRNEIYQMRNGIIMRSTVSNIYCTDFHDFEGNWVVAPNIPLLDINQYGIYSYFSYSTITENTINNVKHGIHGNRVYNIIEDNVIAPSLPMEVRTRGITATRPDKIEIKSNEITNGFRSISLEGVTNPFWIYNNNIDRTTPPLSGNAGILVRNQLIPANLSGKINLNTVDIEDGNGTLGIYLINAANMRITSNSVNYTVDEGQDLMNRGFGAVGTALSLFDYNDVTADALYQSQDNFGMLLSFSRANKLSCNSMLNFEKNLEIEGPNIESQLHANTIDDAEFGLHFMSPVMLGVQRHNGNLWIGSYGNNGAFIGGLDDPTVSATFSKFYVNSIDNSDFHPGSIGPSEVSADGIWFKDENIAATEPACLSSPIVPFADPDSLEVLIKTPLNFEDYAPEMTWLMKADVFELMLLDPTLHSNAVLDSFYDAEVLNPLGKLVTWQFNLASRFGVDRTNKELTQDTINTLVDDIISIDAIIVTNPIDLNDWLELRALKVDSLDIKLGEWLALIDDEVTASNLEYADIANDLGNLTATNDLEDYLQKTLLLKCDYLLGNTLTSQELDDIKEFGRMCPVLGGRAVGLSHELFATYFDSLMVPVYDNCPSNSPFIGNFVAEKADVGSYLTIFPNPVGDFLEIKSSSVINEVLLLNSVQNMIHSYEPMKHRFQINMKDLAPGIYFISIVNANGREIKQIIHL